MVINQKIKAFLLCLIIGFFLIPGLVSAGAAHDRVVVFGDSLSDPGNAFALSGTSLTPPYSSLDMFLVPGADTPYARGGYHFSNGKTWVERFAAKIGLADSAGPAFSDEDSDELKMTNYAVGGARARDYGEYINLPTQLSTFFSDTQGVASEQSLYILALGGNDLRDAIAAMAQDSSGLASAEIIATALRSISDAITALYSSGARTMMIANAPDLSVTPAIRALDVVAPGAAMGAAIMSTQFNSELSGLLDTMEQMLPGLEIIRMDFYETLHEVIAHPESYKLRNVEDACVMPNQQPASCKKPKAYLFWDGIHPTKRAHNIFAKKAKRIYKRFMRDADVMCPPKKRSKDSESVCVCDLI